MKSAARLINDCRGGVRVLTRNRATGVDPLGSGRVVSRIDGGKGKQRQQSGHLWAASSPLMTACAWTRSRRLRRLDRTGSPPDLVRIADASRLPCRVRGQVATIRQSPPDRMREKKKRKSDDCTHDTPPLDKTPADAPFVTRRDFWAKNDLPRNDNEREMYKWMGREKSVSIDRSVWHERRRLQKRLLNYGGHSDRALMSTIAVSPSSHCLFCLPLYFVPECVGSSRK